MARGFIAAAMGFLFAIGLGLSGMTLPSKVIGFLDVAGDWDPALVFVMGGAVLVYGLGFLVVRKLDKPLVADQFHIPTRGDITPRLIMGAVFFGVGWGLGGYCPGPALTSLITGDLAVLVFTVSMAGGMIAHHLFGKMENRWKSNTSTTSAPPR